MWVRCLSILFNQSINHIDHHITAMANSPLSPTSQPPVADQTDSEMLDADHEDQEPEVSDTEMPSQSQSTQHQEPTRPARETRKDKDLNTFLNQMDKYAPIVLSHLTSWCAVMLWNLPEDTDGRFLMR
jgi:hypothetical protein